MLQTRKEDMAIERDSDRLRRSARLDRGAEREGELHRIDAEVDWNIELGTIMRLAQGTGSGTALLFNNIKDYNKPATPLPPHLRLRAHRATAASR